jgi:hypothetical protein
MLAPSASTADRVRQICPIPARRCARPRRRPLSTQPAPGICLVALMPLLFPSTDPPDSRPPRARGSGRKWCQTRFYALVARRCLPDALDDRSYVLVDPRRDAMLELKWSGSESGQITRCAGTPFRHSDQVPRPRAADERPANRVIRTRPRATISWLRQYASSWRGTISHPPSGCQVFRLSQDC